MLFSIVAFLMALLGALLLQSTHSQDLKKTIHKRGLPSFYVHHDLPLIKPDVNLQLLKGLVGLETLPSAAYHDTTFQFHNNYYLPPLEIDDIYANAFPHLDQLLPAAPGALVDYFNPSNQQLNLAKEYYLHEAAYKNLNLRRTFVNGRAPTSRSPLRRQATPVEEDDIVDVPPPPRRPTSTTATQIPYSPPYAAYYARQTDNANANGNNNAGNIGAGSYGYTTLGNGAVAIGSGSLGLGYTVDEPNKLLLQLYSNKQLSNNI